MKRIRGLDGAPPRLAAYVANLDENGEKPDWDEFRNSCTDGYKELCEELQRVQHGLCAYCEIQIDFGKKTMQVEHFLPKGSDGPHLDYRNLLAGCGVSDNPNYEHHPTEPGKRRDAAFEGHFKPPPRINASCGPKKAKRSPTTLGARILDPRSVNLSSSGALPRLVRVERSGGEIHADLEGCREVALDPEHIEETIRTLNLNCPRLKLQRQSTWQSLQKRYATDLDMLDLQDAAGQLAPAVDTKRLPRFWSTARSFFGNLAEEWLESDEAKEALC